MVWWDGPVTLLKEFTVGSLLFLLVRSVYIHGINKEKRSYMVWVSHLFFSSFVSVIWIHCI